MPPSPDDIRDNHDWSIIHAIAGRSDFTEDEQRQLHDAWQRLLNRSPDPKCPWPLDDDASDLDKC